MSSFLDIISYSLTPAQRRCVIRHLDAGSVLAEALSALIEDGTVDSEGEENYELIEALYEWQRAQEELLVLSNRSEKARQRPKRFR